MRHPTKDITQSFSYYDLAINSDAPSTFRNNDGVEWCRYSDKHDTVKCEYDIPFTDKDIRDDMQECLEVDRLFISYIKLDFFTLPMWPLDRKNWSSPYDGIFYNCLECDAYVGPLAQLCIQFYLPAFLKINVNEDMDQHSWSWIPRVICYNCSSEDDEDAADSKLTFFPFCMFSQQALAREINKALQKISKHRALQALAPSTTTSHLCVLCYKPLPARGKKGRKRRANAGLQGYCSTLCASTHRFMQVLKGEDIVQSEEIEEHTTGLFQLIELFDTFQGLNVDVNRALSWETICNSYENHLDHSHVYKDGEPTYICGRCHRVSYCSPKCRSDDRANGHHLCISSWDSVFTIERLYIQQE